MSRTRRDKLVENAQYPSLSRFGRGCGRLRPLRGKIFLLHRGDDHVVGIDHFGEADVADFGQEFVGVHLGEAVVAMDPANQFGVGNAEGVVDGAISANRHDGVFVFESRPIDLLSFDDVDLKARAQRDFDGRAGLAQPCIEFDLSSTNGISGALSEVEGAGSDTAGLVSWFVPFC